MYITIATTIGFKVPEEYTLAEAFAKSHDLSEWKDCSTTGMICYKREEFRQMNVEIKINEKDTTHRTACEK